MAAWDDELIKHLRALAVETAARISAARAAAATAAAIAPPLAEGPADAEGSVGHRSPAAKASVARAFDLPPAPLAKRLRAGAGAAAAAGEAPGALTISVAIPPPPPPVFPAREAVESLPEESEGYEVVQIPDEFVGLLIGKGGCGIRRIQGETGATVTVGKLIEEGTRKVCLEGAPSKRERAREWIASFVACHQERQAASRANLCTEVMDIPERFARDVIGPKGTVIQALREATGVSASMVKEGTPGESTRKLTLKGTEEVVQRAREQVERLVLDLWRQAGIFNTTLEEKYGQSPSPAPPLVAPPPPLAPAAGIAEAVLAAAVAPEAEAIPTEGCPSGGAAPPPSSPARAAPCLPSPAGAPNAEVAQPAALEVHGCRPSASCLPLSHEEITYWAAFYASDPAFVNCYAELKHQGFLDHTQLLPLAVV